MTPGAHHSFIEIYIHTIYVYCWKIKTLFVEVLETGRKESLWRDFLVCFAAK